MKNLFLFIACIISFYTFSQNKYITKTGHITFEASVPSFEEVKATNKSVTAIINTDNGEFAALVLVKGFRFKNALMEEHFNENYMESEKYPKTTFKGEILNFDLKKLSTKPQPASFSGKLTFHGKTKAFDNSTLKVSLNSDNDIVLTGSFNTNVDEYNIEIPKIVSNKLSKTVKVDFNFILKKK